MDRLFSLILFAIVTAPIPAMADCIEQQQELRLDENNVSTIKSYRCAVGAGGDQLTIAFYQLSGVAAGIVLGQSPAMPALSAVFGPYELIENPVTAVYASLFGSFSHSFAIGGDDGRTLFASITDQGTGGNSGPVEGFQGNKVRAILIEPNEPLYYPVTQQLSFLQQGQLPPGMKFYYWVVCGVDENEQPDCASYRDTRMVMWRGMTLADLKDYNANLAIETATITSQGIQTSVSSYYGATEGVEGYLKLVQAVAGDSLPEDFLILELSRYPEGCAGDAYWNFQFAPRDMALRVAVVTNASNRPVVLDSLFGTSSGSLNLRVAPQDFSPSAKREPIAIGQHTLSPGGSIVVPFQIRFPAPSNVGVDTSEDVNLSNAYYSEVGAAGLGATDADYAFPQPRDYAFGPEIGLSGIRANGTEVSFAPRSANFVEVVASYEAGSCPYLLVWDKTDHEWVDHGKILHAAKGTGRQETEVQSFAGFQSRFRLEEREPEVASIDKVALEVTLRDGRVETLPATQDVLAKRDGSYLQLFWDDAIELAFDLPESVAEDDVLQSRLHVTGFYRPYAQIRAAKAGGDIEHRPSMCPTPPSSELP